MQLATQFVDRPGALDHDASARRSNASSRVRADGVVTRRAATYDCPHSCRTIPLRAEVRAEVPPS